MRCPQDVRSYDSVRERVLVSGEMWLKFNGLRDGGVGGRKGGR